MKEFDLKTKEDVIRYWRINCVNSLAGHSKIEVASWIVGAMVYADQGEDDDRFNKWCEDDEDFAAVFNRAWTLETEPPHSMHVDGDWREIIEGLTGLEAKYKIVY